jgi:hypothetical protein
MAGISQIVSSWARNSWFDKKNPGKPLTFPRRTTKKFLSDGSSDQELFLVLGLIVNIAYSDRRVIYEHCDNDGAQTALVSFTSGLLMSNRVLISFRSSTTIFEIYLRSVLGLDPFEPELDRNLNRTLRPVHGSGISPEPNPPSSSWSSRRG